MKGKSSQWTAMTTMTSQNFHFTFAIIAVLLCMLNQCHAQSREDPCRPTNGQFEVFKRVSESAQIGDIIYDINIPGSDDNILLTSDFNEFFAFDPKTRKVIVNGTLDAETSTQSQQVVVVCKDLATGRTSQISVTVSIKDANDHGPEFSQDLYNLTIGEMTDVNSVIRTNALAKDADATPDYNIVYYSIVNGPFSDYFVIVNPLSPDLTLLKKLDYETLPQMRITIMAMDQPKSGNVQFNSTCEVAITVRDEDDQYPVFNSSMYRGVITNAASVNSTITIIPHIYAYDPDRTINAPVVYSFHDAVGQSKTILDIDPDTAVVTLINYPTADEVYLLIQATQVDNPSRYGVALLAVQAQGSNVNAPAFARPSYRVVVTEVFPVGEVITSVMATDADPGSLITYRLENPSDAFEVQVETGDIILRKELTYSGQPERELKVIASDGSLESTATVTIVIRPVNIKPPRILTTQLNVTADRTRGYRIIDIDAEDTDEGAVLSYRLLNHNDLFSIDKDGVITISGNPDNLILDLYSLMVVVSDGGTPSYEKAAAVTVNFPNITPVASAQMAEDDSIVPIVLGAVAGILLIIVIVLIVYICRRRLRDKEHLDRVKRQHPSQDPKVLAFKQKHGTLGRQAKQKIDFRDATEDDDTTIQENPLSPANKGAYYNFGMVNNSDTDTEMDPTDIQVETSVAPFQPQQHNSSNDDNNNENIYNSSQLSVESEDYTPAYKNTLTPFFRNGSISTYRDSSGSEASLNFSPTASADSKKGLMPGSLAHTRVPEENGGVWDRHEGTLPAAADMPNLDPDASVVPSSQKQELTVYF